MGRNAPAFYSFLKVWFTDFHEICIFQPNTTKPSPRKAGNLKSNKILSKVRSELKILSGGKTNG
jgi:hypothetical protein